MAHTARTDLESLQLCLRLAASPDNAAFKVTIELSEVDLVVEAIDLDLRSAIQGAAFRCASKLRQKGYSVTSLEIVQALDDAMASADGAASGDDRLGAFSGPRKANAGARNRNTNRLLN